MCTCLIPSGAGVYRKCTIPPPAPSGSKNQKMYPCFSPIVRCVCQAFCAKSGILLPRRCMRRQQIRAHKVPGTAFFRRACVWDRRRPKPCGPTGLKQHANHKHRDDAQTTKSGPRLANRSHNFTRIIREPSCISGSTMQLEFLRYNTFRICTAA